MEFDWLVSKVSLCRLCFSFMYLPVLSLLKCDRFDKSCYVVVERYLLPENALVTFNADALYSFLRHF
jgi:hypothetical protein